MKFISKKNIFYYLFFVSLKLYARDIILIENLGEKTQGKILESILIKKFHFPRELITLRNTDLPCEEKNNTILHLCLLANGELIIKKIDHYILKNSFGVFLNESDERRKRLL